MFVHTIEHRIATAALLGLLAALPGCGGGDSAESGTASGDGTSGGNTGGSQTTAAPQITQQPQSTTVLRSNSATFTIEVKSDSQPAYQWRRNGAVIPGATLPTYTTGPAVFNDDGAVFDVIVTNSAGAATSQPASLTVQNKYAAYLLAGEPVETGSADGVGAVARFNRPGGPAVDDKGNAYVADSGNFTIRKIEIATSTVSTVAGEPGEFGIVDGDKKVARLGGFRTTRTGGSTVNAITGVVTPILETSKTPVGPEAVTLTADGSLVFSDGNTIRRASPDGIVQTLLGVADQPDLVEGTESTARFNRPGEIVSTSATATMYLFDGTLGQGLRKLSLESAPARVDYFSGSYLQSGFAGGPPSAARYGLSILVPDRNDGLYVVGYGQFGALTHVDGSGNNTPITTIDKTDGRLCRWGAAGAVDTDGSLYVVDGCRRLLKALPTGEFSMILDLADSLPASSIVSPLVRTLTMVPGSKRLLHIYGNAIYIIYLP